MKNMSPEQFQRCIALAQGIVEGREDLVALDNRSLEVRGKVGKGRKRVIEGGGGEGEGRVVKRAREEYGTDWKSDGVGSVQDSKEGGDEQTQLDIRALLSSHNNKSRKIKHDITSKPRHRLPSIPATTKDANPQQQHADIDETISHLIATSTDLTPFRKKVLLLLTQVPPGHYTTYAALSTFLHSSPRAVGNAMRNNPFAPTVPCHRVLAANGGIGGFGGEWGEEGKHAKEKIRLLRGEGVRFDGKGRVVGRVFTGFV